jgi:hypothetical protein
VTTHAPLRSQWTKAESAYHVRLTGNGDSLPSPSKDTRLEAVACKPLFDSVVTHIDSRALTWGILAILLWDRRRIAFRYGPTCTKERNDLLHTPLNVLPAESGLPQRVS